MTMVYAHLAPNAKRSAVESLLEREADEPEETGETKAMSA